MFAHKETKFRTNNTLFSEKRIAGFCHINEAAQTRMIIATGDLVLGRSPSVTRFPVDDENPPTCQNACRILRDVFHFVGLTERWRSSIYLFQKTFNTTFPVELQMLNTHPNFFRSQNLPTPTMERKTASFFRQRCEDPVDKCTYHCAVKIFQRRQQAPTV